MIFKFKEGGTWIPPLASYQPVTVTDEGGLPVATASSSKSSNLTDKDLIEMMSKLDGLPSDMERLTTMLSNFYIDQQHSPYPNTANIASRYLAALTQMRTANFNKKEYDNAFNIIQQNGGINEVAVDERGYLYCMNAERDFKLIRPEDLKNNQGYQPLTNSELLYLRAYNPDQAFNQSIIGVVQNGIGIKTVTDMIKNIISSLGSSETQQQGYVSAPAGKLINGIKELTQATLKASQEGIKYDGTSQDLYSYDIINKNSKNQIDMAMAYILNTLPENAKSLLKTKTRNGSDKEVQQLIEVLISSQVDSTQKFSLDLEAGPSKDKITASKKGESSSSKSAFPGLDPVSLMQAGYGEKQMVTIQTAEGGQNALQIPTVRMPITTKEGKSLGTKATLSDVSESGFAGYLDFENVSMGGTMIPSSGLQDVAVNATALYAGYLPMDVEEYNKTGNIRPDIKMLQRYKEAQAEVKEEQATTPEQINAIYVKHNLPVIYTPNGDVVSTYRKFGIINGTAFDQAFQDNPEFDEYIFETSDQNEIANALSIVQKGRNKEDRLSYDSKSWYNSLGIGDYNHVYKGTIFIPINEDYFTSTAGFGIDITAEQAEAIEAKQQAEPREKAANTYYVNPGKL